MVDLHTHILPGVDDGPGSIEESLALLKMEHENGVSSVAFTPHFSVDEDDLSRFLERRQTASDTLLEAAAKMNLDIQTVCAAEVALSPQILKLAPIESLCYKNTSILLVELPMSFYQDWIPQVLYELNMRGFTAVIAHVERYPYFMKNIRLLQKLIDAGSIAQVNASSFLSKSFTTRKHVKKLVRENLVQVISSDAHSIKHRPPRMPEAMALITKKYGNEYAGYLVSNGKSILNTASPTIL